MILFFKKYRNKYFFKLFFVKMFIFLDRNKIYFLSKICILSVNVVNVILKLQLDHIIEIYIERKKIFYFQRKIFESLNYLDTLLIRYF